jgi:hypothetical protein
VILSLESHNAFSVTTAEVIHSHHNPNVKVQAVVPIKPSKNPAGDLLWFNPFSVLVLSLLISSLYFSPLSLLPPET